jgi:hypothetical protein
MDAPHCLLNTQDFRLVPTMAIITTSFISLTEQLTPPPDKATKLGEIPSHSQFHCSALENNRQCQCSQMQLFHMSGFSPSTCLPDETMIPPIQSSSQTIEAFVQNSMKKKGEPEFCMQHPHFPCDEEDENSPHFCMS